MKGYIEHLSADGHQSWLPLYHKRDIYALAEEWLHTERARLEELHAGAYLYINARTLEYIAGESHDSCARGWSILFTTHPDDRNILALQL